MPRPVCATRAHRDVGEERLPLRHSVVVNTVHLVPAVAVATDVILVRRVLDVGQKVRHAVDEESAAECVAFREARHVEVERRFSPQRIQTAVDKRRIACQVQHVVAAVRRGWCSRGLRQSG